MCKLLNYLASCKLINMKAYSLRLLFINSSFLTLNSLALINIFNDFIFQTKLLTSKHSLIYNLTFYLNEKYINYRC